MVDRHRRDAPTRGHCGDDPGGAISNLLDRIFRADDGVLSGEVVDFIDVTWYAVFNVADIFVVCGAIAFGANEIWLSRQVNDEIDAVEPIGDDTP